MWYRIMSYHVTLHCMTLCCFAWCHALLSLPVILRPVAAELEFVCFASRSDWHKAQHSGREKPPNSRIPNFKCCLNSENLLKCSIVRATSWRTCLKLSKFLNMLLKLSNIYANSQNLRNMLKFGILKFVCFPSLSLRRCWAGPLDGVRKVAK